MPKSETALAVDAIQSDLAPLFKSRGFRKRGRVYNRITGDGLTQVVTFQMGAFDPPGTTYHPGLRENLYGRFTVNLGVFIPQVAKAIKLLGPKPPAWINEAYCTVRARLPETLGQDDTWWPASSETGVTETLRDMLETAGLPLLDRFSARQAILAECQIGDDHHPWIFTPPRMVGAILLADAGDKAAAGALLDRQIAFAKQTGKSGHARFVEELKKQLLAT